VENLADDRAFERVACVSTHCSGMVSRAITIALIAIAVAVCGVAYFYEFTLSCTSRSAPYPDLPTLSASNEFADVSASTAAAVTTTPPPSSSTRSAAPPAPSPIAEPQDPSPPSTTRARTQAAPTGAATTARPAPTSSTKNPAPVYDLLVIIPVAAGERSRRDAIRKSWMRYMKSPCCKSCGHHSVHTIFIVGNEGNVADSHAEANETGDLHVLDDFGQSAYYTMRSQKTAYSIRYAVEHFNFRFLLKTDSDSWVFYDRLLDMFDEKKLWSKGRLYAGNFQSGAGAVPHQDKNSKWYDPVYKQATQMNVYPRHAKGAGYILSRSLAEYVATVQAGTHEFLPSEDVATGFWLSPIKKECVELPVSIQDSCGSAAKGPIIDHYIVPGKMQERWSRYEQTGNPCTSAWDSSSFRGSQAKSKCSPTQ